MGDCNLVVEQEADMNVARIGTRVGVIGAGIMGAGIAQRCAMHDYPVTLVDVHPEVLRLAGQRIRESLGKFEKKNSITSEGCSSIMQRIAFRTELGHVSGCDLVIEAVNEDADLKRILFNDLGRICRVDTILASNTSSIPIHDLARETNRPGRVIGLHFMNPVPLISLVELIRSSLTANEVVRTCAEFVRALGCEVVQSEDRPGFIINRILMPMINEAAHALRSGVASAADIDRAMVLGTKQPIGPLALADLIGLDTVVHILETLQDGFGDDRFRPCPLLEEYVEQNRLGRKTGHGFFEYGDKCQTALV